MAGSFRVLISRALEDLDQVADLPKFTLQMQAPRKDAFNPKRFRKGQVHGKNFLELANVLTDAFGDNAVSVTVELLRAIDQHRVADELEAEAQDQAAPGNNLNSGGASGSAAQQEHFVDRHRNDLIDRVSNIKSVLDHLLFKKVLRQEQYDEAMGIRPVQDQMRFLFMGPLKSGGARSKDALLSVLEELEPYLIEELKEN